MGDYGLGWCLSAGDCEVQDQLGLDCVHVCDARRAHDDECGGEFRGCEGAHVFRSRKAIHQSQ